MQSCPRRLCTHKARKPVLCRVSRWVGKPLQIQKGFDPLIFCLYTLAIIEQRLQNEVNDKASRIVRLEEEMSKAKNDGLAKDSETSQLKVRLMHLLLELVVTITLTVRDLRSSRGAVRRSLTGQDRGA